MDAISMYDRGRWSSKSDTLPVAVVLAVTVALALVPMLLLLVAMR